MTGFFRGITGIVTKPIEGARDEGAYGLLKGFGKGIVGVAAQPMAGIFDFVQKGAEGTRMSLKSAVFGYEEQSRKRLPRAVAYDGEYQQQAKDCIV